MQQELLLEVLARKLERQDRFRHIMTTCVCTATYSGALPGVRKNVDVQKCPISSIDPIKDLAARIELETSALLSPTCTDLAELRRRTKKLFS